MHAMSKHFFKACHIKNIFRAFHVKQFSSQLVTQLDDLSPLYWDLCIDHLYLQHPENTTIYCSYVQLSSIPWQNTFQRMSCQNISKRTEPRTCRPSSRDRTDGEDLRLCLLLESAKTSTMALTVVTKRITPSAMFVDLVWCSYIHILYIIY